MNTQLPLRGATALRGFRKAPCCPNSVKIRIPQSQVQSRSRLYSTPPPPPKTYFQPGDSQAPDPKYFQPVDSSTLPSSPPITYFQPGKSHSAPGGYPPNTAPPSPPRRSLRPYVYSSLFLALGLTIGGVADRIINPLPPLEPGSQADLLMIQVIHELAEKLPIVQSLSTDPEWTSQDAFDGLSSEAKKVRLTSGPLGGTRALGGFRRAFYHKTSGESVTIIHFGDAISGFPKITHGGVIATVLDEVLGICAIRQFPAKTGVTANLELNYLAPAQTGHFYIIRAVPVAQGMTDRKCFVTGTVETVTGRILVEAKGLFVVPKKLALRPITT